MERIATAMPAQFARPPRRTWRAASPPRSTTSTAIVVRRGAELGVPTPVNQALHALVKLAEHRSPHGA
jgi:2-dehydropantoate 2-reductase